MLTSGVTSERLAIGLLFVVIGTLACFAPAHSDTWWHLRAGQDIWRSGTVSLIDTYSHTAAGREFPNHEWLTELVFYGLYAAGGLPALTAFCAVLIVTAYATAWRMAKAAFEAKFLIFAVGLACSTSLWALRPQVFTLALFAFTCSSIAGGRRWPLPIVFAVWANLHGGVALGGVAVAAVTLWAVLFDRKAARPLLVTLAACTLATLVSPLGWRLWTVIPESIQRSSVNNLIEWRAPDFSATLAPFWLAAVLLPVVTFLRRQRLTSRTSRQAVIALAVLPLALRSFRNVPMFMLIGMPALAGVLRPPEPLNAGRPVARERTGVNAGILGAAAVVALLLIVQAWMAPAERLGWQPISPDAARAIETCPEPLYNTYGGGGILLWFVQSRKVFIDNRQDPYPIELMAANSRAEAGGDYQPLFAEYGIRCAALTPHSAMAAGLGRDPAWTIRFADDQWIVFAKK